VREPSAPAAWPGSAKGPSSRTDGSAGRPRKRSPGWRAVSVAAALAVLVGGAAPGSAQNATRVASEESVKAAYLFKFPAYVDWPPSAFEGPDSEVTIAVIEDERLAGELLAVTSGRTVGGRPIRVRRLSVDDPLAGVHVLLLPARERDRFDTVQQSAGQPILTVADTGSATPGVVLTFVTVDGRVRFEVDLGEAERRGLRLHSGLLAVAERVRGARR
jgi:hypothetical protein